jgi:hypothetical protein
MPIPGRPGMPILGRPGMPIPGRPGMPIPGRPGMRPGMPIPGRPAKECPPLPCPPPWAAAVTSGAVNVAAKRQLKKITSFEFFIGSRVSKYSTPRVPESCAFSIAAPHRKSNGLVTSAVPDKPTAEVAFSCCRLLGLSRRFQFQKRRQLFVRTHNTVVTKPLNLVSQ